MWILNKKIIILSGAILFLALITVGIFMTFKPSLTIIKNSEKTKILLDEVPFEDSNEYKNAEKELTIKIERGKHKITFYEFGFLKEEVKFSSKLFGNTTISYKAEPGQKLLEELPIVDTSNGFLEISGYYNDYFEPVYHILGYETDPKRGDAILKSKGVDLTKVIIEYEQDGD